MRYYLRKIGFFVLTLWAVVTLNFLIPGGWCNGVLDVTLRVFDADGRDLERHVLRVDADSPAAGWLARLGRLVNRDSRRVRLGAVVDED